jgi:hypothetical protein
MEIAGPASADRINWEEHLGRLLLVIPLSVETDVSTTVGVKDVTVATVHALDGAAPGLIQEDAFVFPKVLQSQLRPFLGTGKAVIGRLAKGSTKPGQRPPWKLLDPTPADLAVATAYIEGDPGTNGGGGAPVDPEPDPGPGTPPPSSGIDQAVWDGMPADARKAVADALPNFGPVRNPGSSTGGAGPGIHPTSSSRNSTMPEDVTKRLAVTFADGLPLGKRASFRHDGQAWLAYPAKKQQVLFALVDRMVGALARIQAEAIRWLSAHPDDAARVAMLLRIIADANRIKEDVIENKAPAKADR